MKIGSQISLSTELEALLNKQVAIEAAASFKYLAMAAWCDDHGYDNSADFFYDQSDEERTHMLKIFRYICDMGGSAISPAVAEFKPTFNGLREVFELALQSEIMVSDNINAIVAHARSSKDYATENFMQWFVQEQIEEEYITRRAVELFDLIGEDKLAIFMIDERIPKIQFNKPQDTGAAGA